MSLQQIADLATSARTLANSGNPALESQVLSAGRVTNDQVNAAMGSAQSTADGISANSRGQYERQLRGLGVNQTASAKAAAERRLGLSRALVSVDARNRSVEGLRSRADIARSGARDLRGLLESSAFGAQGAAANMAADREIQYQQELAQYKQSKAAGLGQLASIGAMFIPGVGPFMSGKVGSAVTKAAL